MPKHSAGLLLYRLTGDGPEVLLVHPGGPFWARKDLGVWSVPKGEVEEGKDPVEVALAEFEEELGSAPPVSRAGLVPLGTVQQKGGKIVTAWCANGEFDATVIRSNTFPLEWPPRSGKIEEFPEVDRAAWFGLPEARLKLIAAQAELIDRLEALLDAA
jgi:predicted NUDIX family NTP pyrophosphohydrolase